MIWARNVEGGRDIKDERNRRRISMRKTKTNTPFTTVGSCSSRNLRLVTPSRIPLALSECRARVYWCHLDKMVLRHQAKKSLVSQHQHISSPDEEDFLDLMLTSVHQLGRRQLLPLLCWCCTVRTYYYIQCFGEEGEHWSCHDGCCKGRGACC